MLTEPKGSKMQERRLKPGEYIAMSPEEKKEHDRMLQRRWRHKHSDWVKTSNKKWADHYKETKPFKCVCKKCGCDFYKPRNCYKICPDCWIKIHAHAELIRNTKIKKQNAKNELVADIIQMRRKGLSQAEIAKKIGRTQSGVSVILRSFGIRKKDINKTKIIQ